MRQDGVHAGPVRLRCGEDADWDSISFRQAQVVGLFLRGFPNPEIAMRLGVDEEVVAAELTAAQLGLGLRALDELLSFFDKVYQGA
ncbi:MAG: hypothetical protein JNG85_10540 [Spirochaetaceae bacterium]|nr:hypothetical protein [Spirochaetaceae bacterium]